MNYKPKIIVAMSGGVDSSVAAALLVEKGFEVIGVTMKLLPNSGLGFGCCGSPDDLIIAKRSAEKIGIPHYTLDYAPDFKKDVIDYFIHSYVEGETPNPCLACNRFIKFDKLKKFAVSMNASHLATGHYARIVDDSRLFESVDPQKDQSYVLFHNSREELSSTLFPVGETTKPIIREIAQKWGLPNADKKDSQEICFVPNRDYKSYLLSQADLKGDKAPQTMKAGSVVDQSGKRIGDHQGVAFYTIGQRNGFHVNSNFPLYVTELKPETNTLVVGRDEENLKKGLIAHDVTWIAGSPPETEFKALVKIRYKHEPTPAFVKAKQSEMEVIFDIPQRAVSPGQAAVIYRWDEKIGAREVLGGGKIAVAVKA